MSQVSVRCYLCSVPRFHDCSDASWKEISDEGAVDRKAFRCGAVVSAEIRQLRLIGLQLKAAGCCMYLNFPNNPLFPQALHFLIF